LESRYSEKKLGHITLAKVDTKRILILNAEDKNPFIQIEL